MHHVFVLMNNIRFTNAPDTSPTGPGADEVHVRRLKEMGLLDRLFGVGKTTKLRSFICSSCFETESGEHMHVLPWWNPEAKAFFMTNRCPSCFDDSLDETSERIEQWDDEAEDAFEDFLHTWKILKHFPELEEDSTLEIAENVLDLVIDTDGKAFVPLSQGAS